MSRLFAVWHLKGIESLIGIITNCIDYIDSILAENEGK